MATPTNNTSKKQSSFLMQGMLLAGASLLSRIIGLVYRIPLTGIIGKTGNDNYGTAFSIYNILLIISSYSIPLALSKMIATRMADGKVRDAKRVLNLGFAFAVISGGTAFLIVFFGADFFAGELLKTPNAAFALKILSPALLIVALLGVMRGFFQGLGTMVPSAISQIAEQIVNAIVSVIAAYMLFNAGLKVSKELAASYGAGGGTLGTVSGALCAFLFLSFVLVAYRKRFKKRIIRDKNGNTETIGSLILVLFFTIVPVLLSTTLYNLSAILDQGLYKNIALSQGYKPEVVSNFWGVFSGQYNVIINIPLAIANSIAASIVPSLASSYKRNEVKEMRAKIRTGLRFISLVSFPCMIGFVVLGSPIMKLLFNDSEASSGYMLMLGAISVLFYSISTLTNGILQGIDKMRIPVIHAGISLILQAGILVVFIRFLNLSIYSVIIANIFYAFLMCVLNERSVKKYTGFRYSYTTTYLLPLLCSLIMGIVVAVIYYLGMFIHSNNTLWTLLSIFIGAIVYVLVVVRIGVISENELKRFPMGSKVVYLLKKIRIIR